MKAVIVDVKGKFVAALTTDGCIVKAHNKNYVIGQVIEMKKITSVKGKMVARISMIAACCLLVFGAGAGAYAYMAPTGYVSMDVNPSIEYTLNAFDRVLSVDAVNEDGARIIKEAKLDDMSNKSIGDVIKVTLNEINKEGYFDGGAQGGIVIATSGRGKDQLEKLAGELKEIVAKQCAQNKNTVEIEAVTVDDARMQEAKALGVTPGKLVLVEKLKENHTGTEEFDLEDWLTKSVREIMAQEKKNAAVTPDMDDSADADDVNDTDDKDDTDDKQGTDDADDDADDDTADDAEDAAADAADEAADKAEDAAEDAEDAAEEADDDAKDLAEDAEDAAKDAAEDAEDAAEEEKDKAEEALELAEDKANDEKDKAKDIAEEAKDKAEEAAEKENDAAEEAEDAEDADEADDAEDDTEDEAKPAPAKPTNPVKPEATKPEPAKPTNPENLEAKPVKPESTTNPDAPDAPDAPDEADEADEAEDTEPSDDEPSSENP